MRVKSEVIPRKREKRNSPITEKSNQMGFLRKHYVDTSKFVSVKFDQGGPKLNMETGEQQVTGEFAGNKPKFYADLLIKEAEGAKSERITVTIVADIGTNPFAGIEEDDRVSLEGFEVGMYKMEKSAGLYYSAEGIKKVGATAPKNTSAPAAAAPTRTAPTTDPARTRI
jgi:hypothetical protein